LLYKILAQAIYATLQVAGVYVYPTTWAFISYYFVGGPTPPTLTEYNVDETRKAVKLHLKYHLKYEQRASLAAFVGHHSTENDWWSSLAGVRATPITNWPFFFTRNAYHELALFLLVVLFTKV